MQCMRAVQPFCTWAAVHTMDAGSTIAFVIKFNLKLIKLVELLPPRRFRAQLG